MILKNRRPIEVLLYAKPSSTFILLVQATKLKDIIWRVQDTFKPLIDSMMRPFVGKAVRTSFARLMRNLPVPALFAIGRAAI